MDEELRAITSTLKSFYTFHEWQHESVVDPKTRKYASLSPQEKGLLEWYPALVRDLGQCIQINQSFLQNLAVAAANDWGVSSNPNDWESCSKSDLQKVRSSLLQLVREWSSEGSSERNKSYQPLLDKACSLFPMDSRNSVKVLVPGCGTGRLVYELVKAGFWTQGNEASYHMLMASGYMLNHVTVPHGETIFPFIDSSSYKKRRLHQLRPVTVPEESPMATFSVPVHSAVPDLMSMTAGSFTELYSPGLSSSSAEAAEFQNESKGSFDVVVTCFFLDTASNIIEYIQSIHHCLKETGIWMNMGPLDWHHEGDTVIGPDGNHTGMEGMEVSRDELFSLIDKLGFEIVESIFPIETTYASDSMACARFVYDCDFWVAKKKT